MERKFVQLQEESQMYHGSRDSVISYLPEESENNSLVHGTNRPKIVKETYSLLNETQIHKGTHRPTTESNQNINIYFDGTNRPAVNIQEDFNLHINGTHRPSIVLQGQFNGTQIPAFNVNQMNGTYKPVVKKDKHWLKPPESHKCFTQDLELPKYYTNNAGQ